VTVEPPDGQSPSAAHVISSAALRRDWEAEEQIYAFVAQQRPTKDEVMKDAGLDTARAESAWERLDSMGLIRPVADGCFDAVDPDAALATTLDRHKEITQAHLAQTQTLSESVHALADRFRPVAARVKASVTVERYDDRSRRDTALLDLTVAARESTDSLHPGPIPTDMEILERSLAMDASIIARGVRVRAIYPQSMLQTPRHAKYLRDLVAVGASVRLVDHAPHDLLVFDRHTALLPGDPNDHSKSMIKVTGWLVKSYVAMYEDYWKRGIPVTMLEDGTEQLVLQNQERDILRLLLQGLSDDVIARTLGVHRRTVQRRVTDVMERLGVTSRIEVGFRLGQTYDSGKLI
jgi:DNA-binding NarL/FixJ family response regulator